MRKTMSLTRWRTILAVVVIAGLGAYFTRRPHDQAANSSVAPRAPQAPTVVGGGGTASSTGNERIEVGAVRSVMRRQDAAGSHEVWVSGETILNRNVSGNTEVWVGGGTGQGDGLSGGQEVWVDHDTARQIPGKD